MIFCYPFLASEWFNAATDGNYLETPQPNIRWSLENSVERQRGGLKEPKTPSGLPIYNMSNEAALGVRKILISHFIQVRLVEESQTTAQTAPLQCLCFYHTHSLLLVKK